MKPGRLSYWYSRACSCNHRRPFSQLTQRLRTPPAQTRAHLLPIRQTSRHGISSIKRSSFSTTSRALKRSTKFGSGDPNKKLAPDDRRISRIRYNLQYVLRHTPRPLKFSRNRGLRHWTIHRAWQLYQADRRKAHELALERQYNSMKNACDELYKLGEASAKSPEAHPDQTIVHCVDAAGKKVDMGWLYRRAMEKKGVWGEVPREYAGRLLTDWPSKKGWDVEWRR